MTKKYRPSNGTEGELFRAQFCDRCKREKGAYVRCSILGDTLFLDVDDPDYPAEWTFDAEGKPVCTAFEGEGDE